MQNASHTFARRFADHCARIVLCITSVHHDRLSHFHGQRQLLSKSSTLLESRRIVVVVVEATFSYRNSSL
jgi:hypothetical protein